jgi:hypothetical protein
MSAGYSSHPLSSTARISRKEARSVGKTSGAPRGTSRNQDNYVADSDKGKPRPRSPRWTAIEKQEEGERYPLVSQPPCANRTRLQLTFAEHYAHLFPRYRDRIFSRTTTSCICIELVRSTYEDGVVIVTSATAWYRNKTNVKVFRSWRRPRIS